MASAEGKTTDSFVERAADEAADWYLKHRGQALSEGDRQSFAAWLRASPLHVREYLAVAALSNDLPRAAEASPAELGALLARARATNDGKVVALHDQVSGGAAVRSARPRLLAALAATVLLAVGALLFWPTNDTLSTVHGEQRTLRLADGSMLRLNTDSRARVSYSSNERLIHVDQGQFLFEVSPDKTRPFRVRAGDTEVLAVGTKFDVYRHGDSTIVTVLEGAVRVSSRDKDTAAVQLAANQQVRVIEGTRTPQPVVADLPTATAWLQGEIRFYRKPLMDVAAEFNRYAGVPIVIEGEALRRLRVSGIFSAYDTDSFVEFVRRMEGVEVRATPDNIRISSASALPAPAVEAR